MPSLQTLQLPAIWADIMGYVRVVAPQLALRWFEDLRLHEVNGDRLIIEARGDVQVRFLEQHCVGLFAEAAEAATAQPWRVEFRRCDDKSATVSDVEKTSPGRLTAEVWGNILELIERDHPALWRSWFKDLKVNEIPPGLVRIDAKTTAQLHYCQQYCVDAFTMVLKHVAPGLAGVVFHHEHDERSGVFGDADLRLALNADYTFKNFVEGPENRLPVAACRAVGDLPGKAYNPLFIHGGVGLGKTHLLQATSQAVLQTRPDARVLYLSCESFINQFIHAVEKGELNQFRYRYRNVDMLVIDDIHFLSDRERTQEEFFHTFNTLYQGHKQIILSADCLPAEIPELGDRLVSRFNWGLVARIDQPTFESRIAIVQKKARMRGISLPDDVVTFVAHAVDRNTRYLEGVVNRIQGISRASGPPIDVDLARVAIQDILPQAGPPTLDLILQAVSQYLGISATQIRGRQRSARSKTARQIFMLLARECVGASFAEIGSFLGGRDHTTIIHSIKLISDSSKSDRALANGIESVRNVLGLGEKPESRVVLKQAGAQ